MDAYTLGTKAVSRGIALENEIGCSKIIMQVIETSKSCDFPSTVVAALFDDIYVQASTFSACEFSFCNKDASAERDGFTPACLSR